MNRTDFIQKLEVLKVDAQATFAKIKERVSSHRSGLTMPCKGSINLLCNICNRDKMMKDNSEKALSLLMLLANFRSI